MKIGFALILILTLGLLLSCSFRSDLSEISEKEITTAVQKTLSAIQESYIKHSSTNSTEDIHNYDEIFKDAGIDQELLRDWSFEIVGNPPELYIATSSSTYRFGNGHKIILEHESSTFSGYSIDYFILDAEE